MALNAKARARKPQKRSSNNRCLFQSHFFEKNLPLLNLQLITFRAKHAKKQPSHDLRWLEKNTPPQYDAAVLAVYQDYYRNDSI